MSSSTTSTPAKSSPLSAIRNAVSIARKELAPPQTGGATVQRGNVADTNHGPQLDEIIVAHVLLDVRLPTPLHWFSHRPNLLNSCRGNRGQPRTRLRHRTSPLQHTLVRKPPRSHKPLQTTRSGMSAVLAMASMPKMRHM